MANNKNRNDVKKNASTLNSGWLKNTLKSMGVASTEMIKDIMPATGETLHSAGELTNDAIKTVRSTRVGAKTLADSISKSSAVKMSQDFFKNALEDIKSGNLYNTERERPLDGFDDSDMDMETLFGDMDDFSFDEEGENPNINVVNQEINRGVDNAATIKAIERGTEYNVRATKATVDTMVSIASTNMLNNNKIGTEVLSQLSSINSNLAALIEYNNTNMTKFIDASIGYYEQMSKPLSGGGYGRFSDDERITADEIYGSHGGLDFKNYKEYVKANIIDMKNMSMLGSMLSMIAENKEAFFGDIIANPIGTILKGTMKAAIPQVTKTAMAALDESIKDFIPVMLERIGGLDEMEGPFSGIASAIAGALGVKTKRKKNFDLTKIEKGPMPYNGYANHTIVEIIPKYLRESNAYLREIAEAVTGKNSDQITKNSTGFDWETGTFKNLDEIRQKVYDEIEARATYEFRNSKFGEKMSSQKYLLKSSKDQENYDQALDQLYGMIEKHRGPIDFKNKEHMDEIMGGINASDSIKNLIESYIEHLQETSDDAIGSAIAAKQKATRERNQAIKDVEMSATEKGIRQFVGNGSYDAYIKEKYNGSKGASVDSSRKGMSKVNVSVPSLLQGIQDTLNRGIYVQIKHKLGDKSDSSSGSSPSYDIGSGRSRRRGRRVNVVPTESTPQTKDEFKTAFAEEANNQAELDEMFSESDSLSTRERFGQSSAKQIGMFKGVIDGIMAGNSDKAFDEFINGMRTKLRQAGEFLSEHFFTPIKKHIFGEKNEDGYIDGGLFAGINNRMKESFYSLRRMITGKGYIDAEGNRVEDANEEEMKNTVSGKLKGMLIGLKEGIHEKLFGKKAENENEDDKEGLLPKAKKKLSNGVSSLLKGLTGWKHALFGESDDEDSDPEEEGKKTLEKMKEKAKDVLPSALTGTLVGSVGGTVAGGYLGMMVGGPIGGALLGLAGGIASRSEKFKDWLFGPEDKDGKRIGGVISENVQDYMKANGKYIAGGAALGMLRAGLTGSSGGILGTLVGGPLAGAILGMGTSMLIKSEMFQKFLFGDEKTGQKGLVKTVKSWFGGLGRNKAGDPSGGKLAGMMGIGAGVGAITLGTLTNVGFLGLSLGPAGPIGGALLGLGTAILAQRKNFKEWLFGKVDPDTGEKREGILGKFKNMMYSTVFLPMKNTVKDLGRRFKTFFYYDVLSKFNLIIEPIGKMMFGGISKLTGHAIDSLVGLGDVIKEDFLMPALEKARKLLAPVTTAVNTIAKGIYTVGTNIIKAPINLLYAITGPIAQAVGKTVKGVASTVAATVNYAIVKPIKNLVIKPLVGAVSLATKIITKPFEIVGSAVSFVSKKISDFSKHVSIFMHNVGQDLKEWIFKKNPIAKGIRNFGKRVKDFGARIKNTFKILVRPLTEFVTTALSEVKNHLVNGISKFFSMLNPINWIKGIYSLLTGKKKDKDPTKMGYLRRAWYEAGEFGLKDAPEGLADEGSYRQRRNALKQAKKHFRQKVTYYAEDGTAYVQSKNGQYYQVTNPDGSPAGTIPASDLPDKTTLTKKVEGVSGKDENKEKHYIERERQKNIAAIGKMTGWQRKDDTLESREIAKAMAAKKGKILKINEAIDTEDAEIRMREARLQQDTLDATEDIKDNTYESSNVLKHILDTLTFGLTMSPEEKQKLREHKQIIKRKAAFLGGYDGEQAKEDEEEARKAAEELAAHQATTLESDGYRSASRRGKKKTDNKYSKIRRNIYEDNYTRHGFFGGLKASFNNLTGYMKGGLSQIWTKGEIPDELKDEENNDAEVPKHATGTRYAKRGPAIVGENGPEAMYRNGASTGRIVGMNGPEVINLQGGETIIPNDKIGSKTGDTTQSNLTDESIMKATDSRKLGLGERILRELLNIKNNTSTITNPEIIINGEDSSDVDYGDEEYDTTNLRRLGRGISSGFKGVINRLPGTGFVRKGARFVKGSVVAGKTVIGAGGELFKMAYGKSRKVGRRIRSSGKRLGNRVSRWFGSTTPSGSESGDDSDSEDSDDGESDTDATVNEEVQESDSKKTFKVKAHKISDAEREEKENAAQAEVSSLTAENRQKKLAEQEEIDSDNAREDAILSSINNIEKDQKEHSNIWNSIFGKKGLITGGIIMLAPLLFKFLKGFLGNIGLPIFNKITDIISSLKEAFSSWWSGLKSDFSFGLENLGDNKGVKDKLIDNAKRGLSVYDENKNADHQTAAREKLRDKLVASKIATFFGKNADGVIDADSKVRGSNNLLNWGKEKFNSLFGRSSTPATSDVVDATKEAAETTAASVDDTLAAYNSLIADSTYGFDQYGMSGTVDDIAKAETENTAKTFKVTPRKATKEAAEATINTTIDPEYISKMRESMWSDISNNFKPTQMTDDMFGDGFQSVFATADDVAKTAAEKTAASVSAEATENIVKDVGSKALKEGVEAGAQKTATDESLWSKVVSMLNKAFTAIRDKVIAKTGGSKVAEAAVKSAPDDVMKQVGKCEKFFPKVSAKISSILGVTAGLGATVVGLAAKEGTWIALGALNGLTGAARLFRVDKPDNLMIVISGIIGALAGTTVGSIIDVINELVVSVLGIDIISQLASLIYTAIMKVSGNDEAAEALREAQDEFQEKFEKDKSASLQKQYETMKSAGLIDSSVTSEQFMTGVESGKYSAHTQSFADYNDEQHKTLGAKVAKGMSGGLKELKKTFIGEKNVTYTDKNGNVYTKNSDGTYQVASSDGKDLGFVSKDAIPEDAVETVEKTEGVLVKVGKSIVKFVTPFIKMLGAVLPTLAGDAAYIVSGQPFELIKNKAKIDDSVPMAGIAKAISFVPKLTGFVPSVINWIGKKLLGALGPVIDGLLTFVSDTAECVSDGINSTITGDIKGLWSKKYGDTSTISGCFSRILTFIPRLVYTVPTAISWVGQKLWDNIEGIGKGTAALFGDNLKNQFEIKKYVLKGDPVGMWKADANVSEDNPLGFIVKALSIGGKLAATPPAALSWVGHKLWDGVKFAANAAKVTFTDNLKNQFEIKKYVLQGDPVGMWKADANVSQDNPLGFIIKALSVGGKLVSTIPAAVSWVGHKIWDGVKLIKDNAKVTFTDNLKNQFEIMKYVLKGDPVGMWEADAEVSEDNPLGFIVKSLSVGGKLVSTIPAAVSWVGHKIWDGVKFAANAAKVTFTDNLKNQFEIMKYVKDGDPVGMWKADAEVSEDNPLGFIIKALSVGGKLVSTIPAALSWVGHKIWNPIKDIVGKISVDWDKFKKTTGDVFDAGMDGDVKGVWSASLSCEDGDILSPLFHFGTGVTKILSTVLGVVMWLPEKVKALVDKVEGVAGDIIDWVSDKWNWLTGNDSDELEDLVSTTQTTIKVPESDEVGGSGEGTNQSATITNVHDIEPEPQSTYYSQNDPRWASVKFKQSDGTDDGATIGNTGCGPTAMAMAISDVTGETVTPIAMAKLAQESGDRDDTGTNWNFVNTAANAYNVDSAQVKSPSASTISTTLSSGEPVVLLGQSSTNTSSSPYTANGHYVVATGLDSRGYVKINDPRGLDHSISVPASDLASETVSMWTFKNNRSSLFPRAPKRDVRKRGGRGNEYLSWLQTDPRWASKKLGKSSYTMGDSGCAVTSVAILTVYSNTITDDEYDPGFLCDYLNDNGGFDNYGNLNWNVVPGMSHAGRGNFGTHNKETVYTTIKKLMEEGYFVTVCVKNGGHYVAVLAVDSDNMNITMKDPAQNEVISLFDKYPASSCDSYHYFKGSSSPIEMAKLTSGRKIGNAVSSTVSKIKDTISPITTIASHFGKYATALFNAILTGNYDINWSEIFADEESSDATVQTYDDTTAASDDIDLSEEDKELIEKIKTKYNGLSPKYDSKTGKYYVYDSNGGKITGTLEELAADSSAGIDLRKVVEDKYKGQTLKYNFETGKYYLFDPKKYNGQSPKYNSKTGKYYLYDNNGGAYDVSVKTGSLLELAGTTQSNTTIYNSAVEKKWGHNAKWDPTTKEYYVYDSNGGKVTSKTIYGLATESDTTVQDLIYKRYRNTAKYDSAKKQYYVNDVNNGQRIYGSLRELAGLSTLDATIDNGAVKKRTGMSPRFDSKTGKYYTFDDNGQKMYSDTPEGLMDYYDDPYGSSQNISTEDLISKAENGDENAVYELGCRATGLIYNSKNGTYSTYEEYKDDVLAKDWVIKAATRGRNLTAAQAIHHSVELDVDSPFNNSQYLSDKDWNIIENVINKGSKRTKSNLIGLPAAMSAQHSGTHGGFGEGVPNIMNGSTYYSQNDPRWANDKFVRSDGNDDGATIGNSGCGPTAMAMALSDATGTTVKPTETAKLAQVMGDRDETGVNWNFINNAANYYGVNTLQSTNPSRQFIESSLDTGSPVVLSGQSYGDVNSPYTSGGHYVVAVGKDGRGNVIINDPRGKNYSKYVNIDTLVNSTNSAWLIGKNTSKNSLQYTTKKYKKRGGKGGVTANDVVTVAANERGYLEKVPGALDSQLDDKTGNANLGPSGSERVKYYRDLNLGNGGYWCAAFVSWCVWSATGQNMSMTRDLMCGGVSASCNTILNNFKAKGQWYTDKPAIGDLILFNWADSGDPLADHIGIVSNIDSEYVYTIEGNSGNPNGDANGRPDGVFDHKYKLSDPQIMGYCRPKYDGTPNFGGITMQYDATLSESSQSNDPSSLFSKAGEAIFKAAYTGNWDIDWDSVFASTPVSSNSSYSSDGAVVNNEVIKGDTIKVPKDVQTGITENYTNYDYWYPKWASSTNQRLIADAWAKKGRKQDRGIAMLDGNYLLAMSPKFGTTGDIVNIKLEDGESFNAILGDSKGADAQSEWGHSFGNSGKADIIEWEACVGSDSATGRGHDGISLEGNWKGKYIDSVTNGGSYMDRIQGGKGDGPVRSGSSKPKKRGGHGEGPSLKTNKYSTPRTNNNYENDYEQSVLVMDKTDIGMTAQQREVVNNTSSYGDENLEKLMREVINILGVISNNSGNLTLLKDIKSGLSGNNTVVSNTANTTVNANGKSKSKQTMQTNARMSRNEEAARKIAFGG